jgi:hypothetical protein
VIERTSLLAEERADDVVDVAGGWPTRHSTACRATLPR